MKKFYGVVVVVFLLLFATSVFAVGPGGGPGMAGPKGMQLSKDQQDKMWQLKERFNSDTSALRYEMFQKRNELKTLFADPKATDAQILAKENEVNALRQKMHDRMIRFRLEQRKILTPEQLQFMSQRGGHGMGGHGQGPRGGGMGGGMGGGGCGF
jgi:Spy/CpxP family protein refolding chaperone